MTCNFDVHTLILLIYNNQNILGDNCIIIVAGANNDLNSKDVEEAEDFIKRAKIVIFQFETPIETTLAALKICAKYSCKLNGSSEMKLNIIFYLLSPLF